MKIKINLFNINKLISDKRNKFILLTGFSTLLIKLVTIGISFITIPMTLEYLGKERYGVLLTLTTALSLMTFADLGLGNSLVNDISKAYANIDILGAKKAISSTFFLILFITIFLALGIFSLIPIFEPLIISQINTTINANEITETLLVIVFSILVNMPLGVVQKVYDGYQESFIYQLFLFFASILCISTLVFFIKIKAGLPLLALAFSSISIVANIMAGVYFFVFKRKELIPSFNFFSLHSGLKSIKIGLIFVLLQFFSFVNLSADSLIIQHFSGIASVTSFELVKKLFSISSIFIFFISPMWPAFSEAIQKGDIIWAKNAIYTSMKLLIGIAALLLLPFLLFGKKIFLIWIGPGFEPSYIILLGFYLFSLISLFGGIVASLFNSSIFLKRQLKVVSIASISTLIAKLFFIKYYGLDYVIWANVLCFIVFFVWPSLREIDKFFNIQLKSSIKN
jgi:O-antigen/teichoic acid export membrane protein